MTSPSDMPLDLDALEALEKKATPGPWDNGHDGSYIWLHDGSTLVHGYDNEFYKQDSDFICAARNALPELIRLARIGQRVERDAKENG